MQPKGKIIAVNISAAKGTRKKNVGHCELLVDFGLKADAHGGPWHRQVSLLAMESIRKMQAKGLTVGPGDFAENICTEGLDLPALPIGTKIKIGVGSLLEVTQIGKVCHTRCAIFYQAGDCVMPREGIFARVLQGGKIKVGDEIDVLSGDSDHQ
jgi:MOSC domain-containing protein YiiM